MTQQKTQENKEPKIIENTLFNAPFVESEVIISNFQIMVSHEPFVLAKDEYQVLKSGNSFIANSATNILAATIGIALIIAAKYFSRTKIEDWELYVFYFGLILTAAAFVLAKFLPNDKKKLLKKIDKHFEGGSKNIEISNKNHGKQS